MLADGGRIRPYHPTPYYTQYELFPGGDPVGRQTFEVLQRNRWIMRTHDHTAYVISNIGTEIASRLDDRQLDLFADDATTS